MPRHHLVPQMLLKHFADPDQKIIMVPRDMTAPPKPTGVRTACAETGFYRIATNDLAPTHRENHDPEGVETSLARVEDHAASVIETLIAGEIPAADEPRFWMATFVALQYSRGWRFREDINNLATASARRELASVLTQERAAAHLREQGEPVIPGAVDDLRSEVLQGEWRLEQSQPWAVQTALYFGMEAVLPELLTRHWRLLTFDTPLLVSDAPVALWSPIPTYGQPVSPGIATARMIILPLDRHTALAFVHADTDKIVRGGPLRARQINSAVAGNAYRWIFHHPRDLPLADLDLSPPT